MSERIKAMTDKLKVIICWVFIAILAFGISGSLTLYFNRETASESGNYYLDNFVIVEDTATDQIIVDKSTGVMYYKWGGTNGGITVILDADGHPLIWQDELP